jgi:hypothetical protein
MFYARRDILKANGRGNHLGYVLETSSASSTLSLVILPPPVPSTTVEEDAREFVSEDVLSTSRLPTFRLYHFNSAIKNAIDFQYPH